jgi:hypothetical protein
MSEESEREAYELRVYERQCFEKQQEEAMIDAMNEDASRRLARYDEMFALLKEVANDGWFSHKDLHDRLQAFLAAEPKKGDGGR